MAELTPETAVRAEIEAMGGQLPQRVSALLARFGYDTTTRVPQLAGTQRSI